MGCGSSKMKVRPLYSLLPDSPTATRIFNWWNVRCHSPMHIDVGLQTEIGRAQALFVIRYNEDTLGATEEIIVNGNTVRISQNAANALRITFENRDIFSGLTNGWCPYFWMDCISINLADPVETAKQKELEPYIYAVARWTLDCTGPAAQIKLGTNAYQSAVLSFGDRLKDDIRAVQDSISNLNRMRVHVPGRVIWTASR
ncbi:hypothetical protein CC78DRAFT_590482 [Lojkania enalia]|uniref:Uncharacterized protein n=1 Tax=Lojkania enalia TaxID=147567 RepID=A0A9P4MZE2_9PLEO|nr:hypothetical protein CC78DRAFT_590482 [Didymosphaeria enalia]